VLSQADLDDMTTDVSVINQNVDTAISFVSGYLTQRFDMSLYDDCQFINVDNDGTTTAEATAGNYVMLATYSDVSGEFTGMATYLCILDTTAATELADTTYFTLKAKDWRHQTLVTTCCDVALYHLSARVAPNTAPAIRKERFDGDGNKKNSACAISWLEDVQKGSINCDGLVVITDDDGVEEGNRITVINSTDDYLSPYSQF